MLTAEAIKNRIPEMRQTLEKLSTSLNVPELKMRLADYEYELNTGGFWDDPVRAQETVRKKGLTERSLNEYIACEKLVSDAEEFAQMAIEEDDEELAIEAKSAADAFDAKSEEILTRTLLSGEYDINNAIVSIHPGEGGQDAQDWGEMLLRMYTRWAERKGYSVRLLDLQSDPAAGIKSAAFMVEGDYAYGYLKNERGVHRLVRISPFDANKRRHTSFTSVDVIPEMDENITVDINPEDLRIDTYRSTGAGGQHINKTDSAVRITHLPTGIVVTCQNERSQLQNKEFAMRMLYSKLLALAKQEHKDKISELTGNYSQITWGSQIRSYVFQPYTMVKDHRTDYESSNVQAVMDGALDPFINASLNKLKDSRS